jgi:hypothetical protein
MISAGWNQANLIAGVCGFFVAVAGLALTLTARHSATSGEREHKQQMRDVVSGRCVVQDADFPGGKRFSGYDRHHGQERRRSPARPVLHPAVCPEYAARQ